MSKLLVSPSALKKNFSWKLAICQHPMYLLIDEDRGIPEVGERVPPWGAPNAAEYVERVRRNLDSLEKFPDLRLNYQFSGVELEAMAKSFPDVLDRMQKPHAEGALGFLGGSFSQPHFHTIGSESNWRQFEFGLDVFKRLLDAKVKVYARQETGLHQQLPQILKKFGYEFMMAPAFPWAMEIIGGRIEVAASYVGIDPIRGDEFLQAQALDSTTLPFFVGHVGRPRAYRDVERLNREIQKDLYSSPPIWVYFPDLAEVNQKEYDEFKRIFDFILLEPALKARAAEYPATSKARVYTYWSYVEGVWAEELLRKNKEAEEAAILAEAMCCMGRLAGVPTERDNEIREIWRTILKYQHHDVYWNEVTDLRRKAIDSLSTCVDQCHQIMSDVARQIVEEDPNSLATFNGLPVERKSLITIQNDKTPADGPRFQRFKDKCFGFVKLQAGGFTSLRISEEPCPESETVPRPQKITTDHYSVEFSEDALMKQITTRSGVELLRTDKYLGGEIRASISDSWANNCSATCRFYSGDVAYIVERDANLNTIPIHETYFFFRNENLIKAEIEFDFNGNEIGDFLLDETKISVHHPTKPSNIYHDIPFGYIQAKENRPLFAINWLYCGGLVHINRGNTKLWVRDGVISNMIAWGGNTLTNRLNSFWAEKTQYDIRLYGKQKIEYFLVPHGKFDGNKISRDVSCITSPVFISSGKGQRSFYKIEDQDLLVTALFEKNNEVWARGYKLPSNMESKYRDWEIFNRPLDAI